jgi:phosphate-selective porin OprO/OprP
MSGPATGRKRHGRRLLQAGSMAIALMMAPSIGSAQYPSPVDYNSSYETMSVAAETPESAEADVEGKEGETPIGSEVEKLFTADEVREIVRQELKAKAEEEEKKKKEEDAAPYVVGSDLKMSASWNNGLELSTKNKDFRVHVGGRTQLDTSWFSTDENVNANINNRFADGTDFRRARFRIDGTMYEQIEWAAEYDFINGARVRNAADTGGFEEGLTGITDLWWTFKELPIVGNCRIGNQKEAIGFERLVSSRYLPFMERSFNQDSFYGGAFNGFQPGIAFFDTYGEDQVGTWNIGVYKPTNNIFAYNATDGDYAVTGRVTRLLRYTDEGRHLWHVGVSGRQASTVSDQITFRTRGAIRAGLAPGWPVPASTGNLYGDDMQWLNGELVGVMGPWTFQSEYLVSGLQDARKAAGDPFGTTAFYHGGYIQLLRFLTGENDHYSKKTGFFERVVPYENAFLVRDDHGNTSYGWGAWQVGARYNYLDLNDGALAGGILHDFTGGLNWFLNPNMKVQFNYSATYRDAALADELGDGWIHGWGVRLAHDF